MSVTIDALLVSTCHLEGAAVVVEFVLIAPAHAVATLPVGCLIDMGQSDIFLCQANKLWCQNDAAGVTTPVFDIESRVVLGKEGVTGVAEDRFDEIEVADQAGRGEKAALHCEFVAIAGDGGPQHGTQLQTRPTQRRFRQIAGEGED